MENLAKALVIAIQYLGEERNDEEFTEDDDIRIVEDCASILQDASKEEKAVLLKVSKELGLNKWGSQIGIE